MNINPGVYLKTCPLQTAFLQPNRLFIIYLCLLFIPLAAVSGCTLSKAVPVAEKGRLDLSGWDFSKKGPARLDGQWTFYRGQLLGPEDIRFHPVGAGFHPVPGLWKKGELDGIPRAKKGFATYRLQVTGLSGKGVDCIFITDILSVGKVFVNGHPLASRGRPGKNKEAEFPVEHAFSGSFPLSAPGTLDILIQVSNFHNKEGGINTPVWLGPKAVVLGMADRIWLVSGVLGAILVIMGIYHLLLYLIRRREKVSLFFGLYLLFWAVQMLFGVNGGCLMAHLFPGLAWRLSIDLTLLPYGFTTPLLVMFFHGLFPWKHHVRVNMIYQVLGMLFVLYILVTPPNAYDPMVLVYFLFTLTALAYVFTRLVWEWRLREKTARFLFPGYMILALTGVNDVLGDLHVLDTTRLVPLGILTFILFHSFVITLGFSRVFSSLEALTRELRRKEKRELELRLVQQRLSTMLDRVEDALVGINAAGEIGFVNQAFEDISGWSGKHMLGADAGRFFSKTPGLEQLSLCLTPWEAARKDIAVKYPGMPPVNASVFRSTLNLEDEDFRFMVLKKAVDEKVPAPHVNADELIRRLNLNQERMIRFEALLDSLAVPGNSRKSLDAIDRVLEQYAPATTPAGSDKRAMAVEIMDTACRLWRESKGTSRAEMAEQSGLWNVYIEKDGWVRTQTLDKYLSIDTLPSRPRWKNVLKTADFVLAACGKPSPLKAELETLAKAFRDLK